MYLYDLGTEQQIKHFGNDRNVMAEILITSHEQFVENKSITHFTRNLAAFKIKTIVSLQLKFFVSKVPKIGRTSSSFLKSHT